MVQCSTTQITGKDKDEFYVKKLWSVMKVKETGYWLA